MNRVVGGVGRDGAGDVSGGVWGGGGTMCMPITTLSPPDDSTLKCR